jgi:hypothetical protein
MVRSDPRNTERDSNMRRFSGLGFTFMLLIALFTVGGYALGRLVGGMPVFVLLGMFVGFAAALGYLYLKLKELGDG